MSKERTARVPVARESCGCTSDIGGLRWVSLCQPHRAEFEQIHEQARRDYEQRRDKRKRA